MAYDENRKDRSCWKKRTRMERYGIVLMVIAILVIIGLIIAVVRVAHVNKKNKKLAQNELESVCTSEGCVQEAALLLKHMDQSVNPCDDFYQFACGGYIKETEIPPEKTTTSMFEEVYDLVQNQIKTLLEEPPKANEPKVFTSVKNLYKTCMNTTAIDRDSIPTVKQYFKKSGGWPLLDGTSWNEVAFDWTKAMQKFQEIGLYTDSLISTGLSFNPEDSTKYLLMIDQPDIYILRDKLIQGFSDNTVNAYYNYLVDLAVFFGAERKFAEFEVKPVVNFQIDIAKITLSDEQRHSVQASNNVMTLAEVQRRYPNIQWLDFINDLLGHKDVVLASNDKINIGAPQYLSSFFNLLNRVPKRVQANYMFFRAAIIMVDYLPDLIRDRQQQFTALNSGVSIRSARSLECATTTSNNLQLAVNSMYVRKHFHEDARQAVIKLVDAVKNEFIQVIKNVDWMDEATRKIAVEKASAMNTFVGYADELRDDGILGDFFAKLNVRDDNYVKAMNDIYKFSLEKSLAQLKEPIKKDDWTQRISATEINSGYARPSNTMQFPAAFLQGVFFNKNLPHYMNYGSMAYVIAHEIIHGFDDQGKFYDKNGNLADWWANETNKAYDEKAKCIIDQYSAITVPEVEVKLNGIITQSENIADCGGIKQAYTAYSKWMEQNGVEPALPALNFTTKQMFWISSATCWCEKVRLQQLKTNIAKHIHSPGRYRVNVPFANTKWFAEDFHCPVGSKMNPTHKCQVW